jgi:predicted O-methyltransferase YrrM
LGVLGMEKLRNIVANFFDPRYQRVMVSKILRKVTSFSQEASAQAWAENHSEKSLEYFENLDSKLWSESLIFAEELKQKSKKLLEGLPELGGGGIYPVLYFLTRYHRPQVVIETGVAAGFSSQTFLQAIKANGVGKLFSSDFPYFRLKNPESFIGILVDNGVKENWTLDTRGDSVALKNFIREVPIIDLFHYDSDKSYTGRNFAWKIVEGKLGPSSIVIFDDIQNNLHFKRLVDKCQYHYKVFEFEGKYAGIIFGI